MFAQCPECKTVCYVSVAELRSTRGILVCRSCSLKFNALESLSDAPAALPKLTIDSVKPGLFSAGLAKFPAVQSNLLWAIGVSLCLFALCGQYYYFQSSALSQNPSIRPWLSMLCQSLKCSLPDYKNLQEISVLHSQLEMLDDNSYQFDSTLVNQAPFEQSLPAVKLSLINFQGELVAQRIFYNTDYAPTQKPLNVGVNGSFQIRLHIAPMQFAVGGYYFELV